MQEPPDQYVVPEQDRPAAAAVSEMPEPIPVVDLSQLSADSPNELALQNWDFFLAVGHGMEPAFLAEAMKAMREFFKLPLEEKQKRLVIGPRRQVAGAVGQRARAAAAVAVAGLGGEEQQQVLPKAVRRPAALTQGIED